MKIFYPEYCIWENDYILNNVLDGIKLQEIHYYSNQNFLEILEKFSNYEKNCILVLTSYLQENEMFQVASILKPNVIIFLSDESGVHPNLMELEKLTRLFLRNYNHPHYNYASNNYQLPLGYVSNFLDYKLFIKKINQRSINCSFIGEQKSDRLEMYNTFKKNMTNTKIEFTNNSWNLENLKWTPHQLFELYNDSIFVINGRGNCSLDCFRIYESISAGAIPVIVGDPKEIKNTFFYNDNIPPLLFFNSWQQAVESCNSLLENPQQLQEIQNNLQLWWKNILVTLKQKISYSLKT
jgi:hypothetical protein